MEEITMERLLNNFNEVVEQFNELVENKDIEGVKKALSEKTNFKCFLDIGLASLIIIQVCINLCVVVGLIPVTGITLPFMSYGGTYTWCLIAILAIIQRINVETKVKLAHSIGKDKKKA